MSRPSCSARPWHLQSRPCYHRKGIDAHDLAALLGKLLIQVLKVAQLTHARLASGEPEVHYGDLVLREQLVAVHVVAIQVLARKAGELRRLARSIGTSRHASGRSVDALA